MRKLTLLVLFVPTFFPLPSISQNVINPYMVHLGTPPNYQVVGAPPGNYLYSLHPAHIDNLIGGWSGEYEIAMKDHFWHRDADIRNNHAVSVIIESASFPFLPPCDEIPVGACTHVKSDFPANHCNSSTSLFATEDQSKVHSYDYAYPATYTLMSAILFGPDKADVLAGYIFQNIQFEYRGASPNFGSLTLKHQYYIDQNIDLTLINPDEKVFYNPSEVIVDPDAGDPQGNFDVQPGSDVTFEAGDVIHLTNGFQVSGGSFSAFTNTNIPDFPVCYDAQRLMPNQPKGKKQKPLADMQEFTLAPNPSSTGVFNIRFRSLPFNGEFSVFNAMGAEVKRIENIRQTNLTVSVEDLAKGIYMFRYREGSGYEIKKVVYE